MTTFGDEEREKERPPAPEPETDQPGFVGRWGGQTILALQNVYDKLLAGRLRQLQSQVIEQDREITQLAHDLAQMDVQIQQMNRRLQSLEDEAAGRATPAADDEAE